MFYLSALKLAAFGAKTTFHLDLLIQNSHLYRPEMRGVEDLLLLRLRCLFITTSRGESHGCFNDSAPRFMVTKGR